MARKLNVFITETECLLGGTDFILNTIHLKVSLARVDTAPLQSACYHTLFKPLSTPRYGNLSILSWRSMDFTFYAVSEDISKISIRSILVFINCRAEQVLNDTPNVTSPQKTGKTVYKKNTSIIEMN